MTWFCLCGQRVPPKPETHIPRVNGETCGNTHQHSSSKKELVRNNGAIYYKETDRQIKRVSIQNNPLQAVETSIFITTTTLTPTTPPPNHLQYTQRRYVFIAGVTLASVALGAFLLSALAQFSVAARDNQTFWGHDMTNTSLQEDVGIGFLGAMTTGLLLAFAIPLGLGALSFCNADYTSLLLRDALAEMQNNDFIKAQLAQSAQNEENV